MKWLMRFRGSEKGQGMVEYGLILALISVVAISALGGIGDEVDTTFKEVDYVTGGEGVDVESIEAESKITVMEGFTRNIKASIKPDDATIKRMSWKSADTSIVTVDSNGVATGVKEGETTITVSSWDNSLAKEIAVVVETPYGEKEITGDFTVQIAGNYRLEVTGGRGGGGGSNGSTVIAEGHLNQGDVLKFVRGNAGGAGKERTFMPNYEHRGGAGGGGSSAILKGNTLLVEARGGNGRSGYKNRYNDSIGMNMVGLGGSGYSSGSRGGGTLPTNNRGGSGGGSNRTHADFEIVSTSSSPTPKASITLISIDE